ncbi:MAG TPA: gamma-glutamyltransferase [Verrucomicrobiae bacterium]|nr:gamma-glutamyltransferase [Verrucomicrobiae bacterium]
MALLGVLLAPTTPARAGSVPIRASHAMVVSQNEIASRVGADVLRAGGNAIDAAVATAFALAVTHPMAGNIGGGGFLVYRPNSGEPVTYDFRETAPAKSSATMFLKDGKYDARLHHYSHLAVGVPGTVAGLHLAWKEQGHLPWKQLVQPAIRLARDGFVVSDGLARSLNETLPLFRQYPASLAQFTKNGVPYQAGETLKQPDLARTLERIAKNGPAGFYEGETAALLEREMLARGGIITRADLKGYQARRRVPVRGTYRGYEVISMPPPSSGGTAIIEILNILEGYNLATNGFGSAKNIHWTAEAMRRAFADRAQYLGDPDFNASLPLSRLLDKKHAAELRRTIRVDHASTSAPDTFTWPQESAETTHFSVVDPNRNAVAMTYTLEQSYGSGIIAPGTGFLLNNEMGDFNAAPGMTTREGLIGTPPNLAAPGKRMLSSMSPAILARDGKLFMVTGSPGGRTIISTVLETILNVVDFGMNAQAAVDAPRFHHQWLPDQIQYERDGLSPDTIDLLRNQGHHVQAIGSQGVAEVIVVNGRENILEAGTDHRAPDGGATGW